VKTTKAESNHTRNQIETSEEMKNKNTASPYDVPHNMQKRTCTSLYIETLEKALRLAAGKMSAAAQRSFRADLRADLRNAGLTTRNV
jgi:hypothetical protein